MKTINYDDIDFSKLDKINVESSESDIYVSDYGFDKKKVFKMFKPCLDIYALTLKVEKLKLLEKRKINDSVVVPDHKILSPSYKGTVEDYIDGVDLWDARDIYDTEDIIEILSSSSTNLESMHEDNIVISDMNFGNIRIDKDKKPHFLDVLSYQIDKIPSNALSYELVEYLKRNKRKIKASENNDRIAFLMLSISLLINKRFSDITDYDYDKVSESITKLNNLRDVFYDLKNSYVENIPYFHQLVM